MGELLERTRGRSRTRARAGRRGLLARATPWLFLAVPLAFLVVFTYTPVLNMLYYSLTSWDGFGPDREFVGQANYTELFARPDLFQVFFVSLFYLASGAVQMVLALYFATVLSFDVRFRNFFKGVLFFPYLINGVAIGFVFLYFFQPGGTLDSVLGLFGARGDHLWLGDPHLVNWSLASVSLWRYLGLNFVLFLGAIQSIPGEIHEAAELDGANRWHQVRHIVLPGIRPVISLSAVLVVSGSLSAFEIPYIMTGGAGGSTTFVIQTVKLAFQFNKVGLASAAAVVLLAVVLLATWIQRLIVPDEGIDLV
ncbi:carbohydrate ABC transporter membrane protein 1 (CUT1 family) [Kitasatospora cineracea]|uniref:Carbohydrate ABC transporter membrane protein 1 (CUT1 family) n=1 Tax=Kitasatospora cineracea TaxID=88074 RepID=A0A3N4SJP5_9ACTN|nr:carbohydrate ABC transporter membrane protein 1 (CUT1 family) [Kitasatospora cineracea]